MARRCRRGASDIDKSLPDAFGHGSGTTDAFAEAVREAEHVQETIVHEYGTFFVALPDNDSTAELAARLRPFVDTTLMHSSGRPWLMLRRASIPSVDVVYHSRGDRRVAVVGSTAATPDDLRQILDRARSVRDLTDAGRLLDGSFCTVGSVEGVLYASAPAFQTRRIHHCVIDGVHLVSDRADVLASLGGFGLDSASLAMSLVGSRPYPLDDVPLWHGVSGVPGGDYVTIGRDGRSLEQRSWWQLPEPTLSRTQGAERFRGAVENAVRARDRSGVSVACDLSGGLDSTPLCYFAALGPFGVTARTLYNDDPGGRVDLLWAQRAVEAMPGVHTHVISSTDEMPAFYESLTEMRISLDEPSQAALAGPRILPQLADDAERGIGIHLNGFGGDHLLRGLNGWQHSLFRSRPLTAWRRARAEDAPSGIGPLSTLRQLLDRRPYRQWLADGAMRIRQGLEPPDMPRTNDWAPLPGIPSWLANDARDAVVDKLLEASEDAVPHASQLAAHLDIASLRDAGRLVRTTGQLGQSAGVAYDSPLMDDHVVEAALAVRREERDTPLEWKPLMKAAMSGLLPEDYLCRTSKIGGASQSSRGYTKNYESLVELCERSGLVDRGIVDLDRFRDAARIDRKSTPPNRVHTTLYTAIFLQNTFDGTTTPIMRRPDLAQVGGNDVD